MYLRNNLISSPVIDENNKLIGRITIDDVVYVIREDADQNLLGMAGVAEDTFAPPGRAARSRVFWLTMNLITAFIASSTINLFQDVLDKIVPTIQASYFMVAVEGHTDTDVLPKSIQSRYPSNWELSGARAAAVVRQLINMEVNPTRLQAVGFAEYIPRDRPTDRVIDDELSKELNATRRKRDQLFN